MFGITATYVADGFPGDSWQHVNVTESGSNGAFPPENTAILSDSVDMSGKLFQYVVILELHVRLHVKRRWDSKPVIKSIVVRSGPQQFRVIGFSAFPKPRCHFPIPAV